VLGAQLANTLVVLAFVVVIVVIVVRIPTAVSLGRKAWSAWWAHCAALNRQEVRPRDAREPQGAAAPHPRPGRQPVRLRLP
jgi:hypothetical protein